jgi:hypothetical protein
VSTKVLIEATAAAGFNAHLIKPVCAETILALLS